MNQNDVEDFTNYLKNIGQYNPRWSDRQINITTAMNKVSELCFYMFGYKHNNSFIFSPLGNLFLEQELESKNQMYIFTTMFGDYNLSILIIQLIIFFCLSNKISFKLLTEKSLILNCIQQKFYILYIL